MRTRRVIGCMTGTSLDALDAALVEISGAGLGMRARFAASCNRALGELGGRLRALASQTPTSALEIASLMREFALLHADACAQLAARGGVDLVCVHGQTVAHGPPLSWQMFQPALVARALAAPIVFDLRSADIAAGGQGAPITPLADYVLFRGAAEARVVVNLGGFCNFTYVPRGPADPAADLRGGDICACNHLLDGLARRLCGTAMDDGGRIALGGAPREGLVAELTALLGRQHAPARSLGTGDELGAWIAAADRSGTGGDILRSACVAIARTIAGAIGAPGRRIDRVLLAGGAVRNAALLREIETALAGCPVETTDVHGVPSGDREAVCMAVLGALCQDGVPITIPGITGVAAPAPLAGCWVFPPGSSRC